MASSSPKKSDDSKMPGSENIQMDIDVELDDGGECSTANQTAANCQSSSDAKQQKPDNLDCGKKTGELSSVDDSKPKRQKIDDHTSPDVVQRCDKKKVQVIEKKQVGQKSGHDKNESAESDVLNQSAINKSVSSDKAASDGNEKGLSENLHTMTFAKVTKLLGEGKYGDLNKMTLKEIQETTAKISAVKDVEKKTEPLNVSGMQAERPLNQLHADEIEKLLAEGRNLDITELSTDQILELHSRGHMIHISQLSVEQLEEFHGRGESINLQELSVEQIIRLQMKGHSFHLSTLSVDQITELHKHGQSLDLTQLTPHQIQELQLQTGHRMTMPQNLAQAQAMPVPSPPDLSLIQQGLLPVPSIPHISPHHSSVASDHAKFKLTMTRSDGKTKEYFVNEEHGNQVYEFCEKVDVTARCGNSASGVSAQIHPQNFLAHTVTHETLQMLQGLHRSQHSDTSSSFGSSAPSLAAGALPHVYSGVMPSQTSSSDYESLRQRHLLTQNQMELDSIATMEAEISTKKAHLYEVQRQIVSSENLDTLGKVDK